MKINIIVYGQRIIDTSFISYSWPLHGRSLTYLDIFMNHNAIKCPSVNSTDE